MNTKALKQKILDLAIHGKLLPLDKVEKIRKEEPASVLLEKIRAEKEEKIAKGELKKDKKDSFIFLGDDKCHYEKFTDGSVKDIEDEIPFDIPDGWSWCRLGECSKIISKGTTPKGGKNAYTTDGVNFLRIENLSDNGSINHLNISHISFEEHESNLKRSKLEEGDLLISIAGTLGKVGFVTKTDLPMNTNQAIAFVRLQKNIFDNMFLKYAIESPSINSNLLSKTKVTSIPNLTLEMISDCLIPLPPLSEQQLIVSEIEKIFAQIDLLEQNKTDLQTAIKHAKSKILNLAIHGKLAHQDPNDEPASILLEKIRAEKEEKIAKGELKKDKKDSFIFLGDDKRHYEKFTDDSVKDIEDEIPFDIPDGWNWCRLGVLSETTDYIANGSFADTKANVKFYKDKNYALLVKTQDFNNNFAEDLTYTDEMGYNFLSKSHLFGGELLLSNIGASIGKVLIVPKFDIPMAVAPNSIVVRTTNLLKTHFLKSIMLSTYGQTALVKFTAGSAMPKFNKTQLRSLLIPLPSLAEQQRIVSKIEEIFAILDRISSELGADI